MKACFVIACLVLLGGCAHQTGTFAELPTIGPINREAVITIAKQEVRNREKWKRVDCEARSRDGGWKVWVFPKPVQLIGPGVVMTMDTSGRLTSYNKFFNDR